MSDEIDPSDPLFADNSANPPTLSPDEAKNAAFTAYIKAGVFHIGDVVFETERGYYKVRSIKKRPEDNSYEPIFIHCVKGGLNKGVSKKAPPRSVEDDPESVSAYADAQTKGGKDLIDFFKKMMDDPQVAMKDRAWAAERLSQRVLGKGSLTEKDGAAPSAAQSAFTLPDDFQEPTYAALAALESAIRACNVDPDGFAAGASTAGEDVAVQPARSVPETGDVS